jgi:hypothetical protein
MSLAQSPKIATDGLVFYYDIANTAKSWSGAPTTNLSSAVTIGAYLNTPSDVTSVITLTGEYYKGSPVYKQVLTPITATGVGYLTNSNNPGIGVVTGGGGGVAARYTGHSIFFKPAAGRASLSASTPIYTHYSNISGWQSTANYDDIGDGWYRANVIYYNAAGGSDGKYWAINPVGATLNIPITIFWAGPFKEDRNDAAVVSPYIYDSRSTTQAVVDITGNNIITATSLTYASDKTFSFNGSNNYIDVSGAGFASGMTAYTISHWSRRDIESRMPVAGRTSTAFYQYGDNSWAYTHGGVWGEYYYPHAASIPLGTWGHYCIVYDGAYVKIYRNAYFEGQQATTGTADWSQGMRIGYWSSGGGYAYSGKIGSVNFYNRALSASEVQQNFNAHRGRYGL